MVIITREVMLRQFESGRIEALSCSGPRVYAVRIGTVNSCTCPGFEWRSRCKHLAAAQSRYAAFYPAPKRESVVVSGWRRDLEVPSRAV